MKHTIDINSLDGLTFMTEITAGPEKTLYACIELGTSSKLSFSVERCHRYFASEFMPYDSLDEAVKAYNRIVPETSGYLFGRERALTP